MSIIRLIQVDLRYKWENTFLKAFLKVIPPPILSFHCDGGITLQLTDLHSFLCISSVSENDRTLVFTETKRGADFLASYLSQSGFPTTSIHG